MQTSILYTAGLGNSAIYMRLLKGLTYYDFTGATWVAIETTATKVYLTEFEGGDPLGSFYVLPSATSFPAELCTVEYVLASTSAVLYRDVYNGATVQPTPVSSIGGKTFLQLCQRTARECGVAGSGPATTIGQTGELAKIVNWVSQSWIEIQEARPDWEFMRKSFTFNTVASQQSYDAVTDASLTDFGMWKNDSFRIYLTSAGAANELFLSHVDYGQFRDFYLYGTRRTTTARPTSITIDPGKDLLLGFAPNDVYTVVGEYYHTPTVLSADGDTPTLPPRFHMLIVYRAMMKYGLFMAAQETFDAGQLYYNEMYNRMAYDQQPPIGLGAPMI